jgi:hypothetical protein
MEEQFSKEAERLARIVYISNCPWLAPAILSRIRDRGSENFC